MNKLLNTTALMSVVANRSDGIGHLFAPPPTLHFSPLSGGELSCWNLFLAVGRRKQKMHPMHPSAPRSHLSPSRRAGQSWPIHTLAEENTTLFFLPCRCFRLIKSDKWKLGWSTTQLTRRRLMALWKLDTGKIDHRLEKLKKKLSKKINRNFLY